MPIERTVNIINKGMSNEKVTKVPGWYSWRHRTTDARDAAREAYKAKSGREARQRRAADRLKEN